jgi:hypothetical protein
MNSYQDVTKHRPVLIYLCVDELLWTRESLDPLPKRTLHPCWSFLRSSRRPQGQGGCSKKQKNYQPGWGGNWMMYASAGNRTRGWPTSVDLGIFEMATANFTTKPPMHFNKPSDGFDINRQIFIEGTAGNHPGQLLNLT